jgi:hypothetical protein
MDKEQFTNDDLRFVLVFPEVLSFDASFLVFISGATGYGDKGGLLVEDLNMDEREDNDPEELKAEETVFVPEGIVVTIASGVFEGLFDSLVLLEAAILLSISTALNDEEVPMAIDSEASLTEESVDFLAPLLFSLPCV